VGGSIYLRFNGQDVGFGEFTNTLVHEMEGEFFGINVVYIDVRHHFTITFGKEDLDIVGFRDA